jgi:tetratricopeptide (TPR) repeat protein
MTLRTLTPGRGRLVPGRGRRDATKATKKWRERLAAALPDEAEAERLLEDGLRKAATLDPYARTRGDLEVLIRTSSDAAHLFTKLLQSVDRLEEEWRASTRYTDPGLERIERELARTFQRRPYEGARAWLNELADAFRLGEEDALRRLAYARLPFPEKLEAGAAEIGARLAEAQSVPATAIELLERLGKGRLEGWEAALDQATRARALRLAAYLAVDRLYDTDIARRFVDKAVELDPHSGISHAERAALNLYVGDFDQAAADAQLAIDLAPDAPVGYLNLGVWAELTGDFDGAQELYQRALDLKTLYGVSIIMRRATLLPASGLLLRTAAEHLLRWRRPAAALETANAALAAGVRGPGPAPDAEVYRIISEALEQDEGHEKREISDAAVEAGRRFLSSGDARAAVEQLERARSIDDSNVEIGWLRADAFVGWDDPEPEVRAKHVREARKTWENWAEKHGPPAGPTSWAYLTRAIISDIESREGGPDRQEGQWEALLYTQRALTHLDTDGRRWAFTSRYLRQLGHTMLALDAADTGYRLYESDIDVLEERMEILSEVGRFDDAGEAARDLVDVSGQTPWVAGVQAWIAMHQERFAEAIDYLSLPLAGGRSLAWYYELRALCRLAESDVQGARDDYADALAQARSRQIDESETTGFAVAAIAATIGAEIDDARRWLDRARGLHDMSDYLSLAAVEAFVELGAGQSDRARAQFSESVTRMPTELNLNDLIAYTRLRIRAFRDDGVREEGVRLVDEIERDLVPRRRRELAADQRSADDELKDVANREVGDELGTAQLAFFALDAHRALARNDPTAAVERFEQLRGSPYEPEATVGLGKALRLRAYVAETEGDVDAVRALHTRLHELGFSDELDTALAVSSALERDGKPDEARRELTAAAQELEGDARAEFVFQRLGDLALAQKDSEDAARQYERALELATHNPYTAATVATRLAIVRLANDETVADEQVSRAVDAWRSAGASYPEFAAASDAQVVAGDLTLPKAVREAADHLASIAEAHEAQ